MIRASLPYKYIVALLTYYKLTAVRLQYIVALLTALQEQLEVISNAIRECLSARKDRRIATVTQIEDPKAQAEERTPDTRAYTRYPK